MRRAAFLGLALATLAVAGCQTLAGSQDQGAALAKYKAQLTDLKGRMDQAAQSSDLPGVASAMKEIGASFDAIEARGSSMNLMDHESLKIQLATGRNTMTETDRWIQVNDPDAVRNQVAQLDPVLGEIDVLLDRAVKSSAPAQ
jgi:hypothetical protein